MSLIRLIKYDKLKLTYISDITSWCVRFVLSKLTCEPFYANLNSTYLHKSVEHTFS